MSDKAGIRPLRQLAPEERGIAVTEFGLIAPVFLMLMIGLYDISHMAYARSVFAGAVERAAREAALESGDPDDADAMVKELILPILPGVELETSRFSYFDFADIDRPEPFTDANGNDTCDDGEAYVDQNNNNTWEADVGVSGNGGANDVIVYTVTATYEPIFKIPFLPEAWNERTLTASAVRKNQPFGDQAARANATTARTCTD